MNKTTAGGLATVTVGVILGVTGSYILNSTFPNSPAGLPQNRLECTHLKAGTLERFTADGKIIKPVIPIRSAMDCSWEWPSEYVSGRTSYWQNPPITAVTATGKTIQLPSTDEYLFLESRSKP